MAIATTRRIAAKLLKAGESRVRINPAEVKKAEEALTTDDVRQLINSGAIRLIPKKGVPRIRARIKHGKKKTGRAWGSGSRKGSKYAGVSAKRLWTIKTRSQRRTLRKLRDSKKLVDGVYRKAYRMLKGNAWRSNAAMLAYFKDTKWVKQE